jgi:peptidoglycan/LPS O-acetylase OafA/YrhL
MASALPDSSARQAHASPASNGQLPSLTPLRGIAALWVVIYHYTTQCFPNLDSAGYTLLLHKGYLAVDMFFMLSGFVMTHVYHRAFIESVPRHYWSFMLARIARIYPLHLLILLLFVITAVAARWHTGATLDAFGHVPMRGPESVSAFVANIFMVQGLNAGTLSWNYPSWSISVEFIAYLAFPFALPLIWQASARMKVVMAIVLVGLVACLAVLTGDNFDQWDGPITLLRCLPEFLLGALLYAAFCAAPRQSWFSRDVTVLSVVLLIALCLHLGVSDLLATCLFAVLVLAAVLNTGVFSRWANVPALIWLGDISFSLYLIHGFIQFLVARLFNHYGVHDAADISIGVSLALVIPMIGLSLVASHLSYVGIEIPCRRSMRSWFAGGEKRRPAFAALRSWPRIDVAQSFPGQLVTAPIPRLIPPRQRR